MNKSIPKNLYLDRVVIDAAKSYVKQRKLTYRGYSLSQLVQELLVREVQEQGVKLPPEYDTK